METIIIYGLIILSVGLWFWALIDISRSRFKDQTKRAVWVLVILFFPLVGSLAYFKLNTTL